MMKVIIDGEVPAGYSKRGVIRAPLTGETFLASDGSWDVAREDYVSVHLVLSKLVPRVQYQGVWGTRESMLDIPEVDAWIRVDARIRFDKISTVEESES